MTFQEIYDEIILITKRPDLVDRTKQAIRAATLKAHQSDFYYKDLIETPVQFTEPFYLQSFVPTEVVPAFRKAKYIRLWVGGITGNAGKFLTPIQIENSIDGYGHTKSDVFYMAGQLLQIRGCSPLDKVLFGCYKNPTVTPEAAYSSWIAVEMPYVIIFEAARTIFKSMSYTEQANEYSQLVGEQFQELKLSYVDDVPLT
jgi:hypothetical protein